jgi:hypothetical protein
MNDSCANPSVDDMWLPLYLANDPCPVKFVPKANWGTRAFPSCGRLKKDLFIPGTEIFWEIHYDNFWDSYGWARGYIPRLQTKMGATWRETFEIALGSARGAIRENELWMWSADRPISPTRLSNTDVEGGLLIVGRQLWSWLTYCFCHEEGRGLYSIMNSPHHCEHLFGCSSSVERDISRLMTYGLVEMVGGLYRWVGGAGFEIDDKETA